MRWPPRWACRWSSTPRPRAILEAYYETRGGLNAARLRMARVPEGADLIPNRMSGAPGIKDRQHLHDGRRPAHRRADARRADRHARRRRAAAESRRSAAGSPKAKSPICCARSRRPHEGCQIGSYPFFREGRTGANFVIRSTDPDALASCVDTLCEGLGELGKDFTPGGI